MKYQICLVSDRRRLSPASTWEEERRRLVEQAAGAARAGVDLIQLRERDLDARRLAELVQQCMAAVAGTPCKILVNDRTDVALAARAHGVHLRSDSIDATAARQILPADSIIGRSVHAEDEAVAATRKGAVDFLILGTMFPSASKGAGHPNAALDELARVCMAVPVPVLAIGGMTIARAERVARAGAAGIAAIGLFIPPPKVSLDVHLESVVVTLRQVFDTCGVVS